jgi:hypothetical protein
METTPEFGAYLQCFKNPYATYKCLESFRKFYPTSTIVIASDNGHDYTEMAKLFNCTYIHYLDKALCINPVIDTLEKRSKNSYAIIDRVRHCFALIKEPYVMWLEDDVIINSRIDDTNLLYVLNGFCPNKHSQSTLTKLHTKYPFINTSGEYRFSGHGGSIFKKDTFLQYLDNKPIIEDLMENWLDYNLATNICQDYMFSLIVILNKGTIGQYIGHYDYSGKINNSMCVIHQYKKYYGVELPEHLKHLIVPMNV